MRSPLHDHGSLDSGGTHYTTAPHLFAGQANTSQLQAFELFARVRHDAQGLHYDSGGGAPS